MQVRYNGGAVTGNANDLTIGMVYECEDDCINQAFINIIADDAGDKHCVAKADCTLLDDRPLTNKPVFGAQYNKDPVPVAPMPDIDDDWEEDETPDPADYLAPGIQVIARDVEPVPDGPKSTDDLRKYRFKPDIF